MFRPYIQRTYVLVALAVVNMSILYIAMNYKNIEYRDKVQAANNMEDYLRTFSDEPLNNCTAPQLLAAPAICQEKVTVTRIFDDVADGVIETDIPVISAQASVP